MAATTQKLGQEQASKLFEKAVQDTFGGKQEVVFLWPGSIDRGELIHGLRAYGEIGFSDYQPSKDVIGIRICTDSRKDLPQTSSSIDEAVRSNEVLARSGTRPKPQFLTSPDVSKVTYLIVNPFWLGHMRDNIAPISAYVVVSTTASFPSFGNVVQYRHIDSLLSVEPQEFVRELSSIPGLLEKSYVLSGEPSVSFTALQDYIRNFAVPSLEEAMRRSQITCR